MTDKEKKPAKQKAPTRKSPQQKTATRKSKAPSAEKEMRKLREQLTDQEQEILKLNEKYLRLAADYDNYRKRTQKEMGQIIEYAGEKVLRVMLPILDDLERALVNHDEESETTCQSLQEGLGLIYKKFRKILQDLQVEPIEAMHKSFDPDLHHAVLAREVESVEPDIVVEEFEKGYMFKDHVLRHAKVVVSK